LPGLIEAPISKKIINIWGVGDGIYVGGIYTGIVFLEDSSKKSCFCLAIDMQSVYNLIRLFQAFYIRTGGVKMQLHLPGFGQIYYNTESVSISAPANWFIQGKSQKKDFVYKKMRAPIVVYM
jgi:hypothetical protein